MSVIADLGPQSLERVQGGTKRPSAAPLLQVRQVSGVEWDQIISGFDTVCQEQLYAFAAHRWPGVVQEPMLFEQRGRIVGGALMMIQPLPLGVGRIAVSKWAPMLAAVNDPAAPALHQGMVDALVADYCERRGMMLSILPRASTDAINAEYVALRERGFRRGSSLLFPNRYIVNLRLSDEEQRKSFQQTWRRQLNKAEKSDLAFEHASADRMDEFKLLYTSMTDRKQFPDHSAYATIDGLMNMEEPLRPELFFVRHESDLVAGALVFKAGDRAVYLYGATNEQALPLRAGYFLHWHIIRWLRDHTRANWYDLGGTDGFQGLHQFKKGMVGDAGVIRPVPPVANYATKPLAYLVGAGAFAARDAFYHVRRKVDGWRNPKARFDQEPHVTEEYLR